MSFVLLLLASPGEGSLPGCCVFVKLFPKAEFLAATAMLLVVSVVKS